MHSIRVSQVEFEWDDDKSAATERRRGFSFETAALIFAGPTTQKVDGRVDYGETRLLAYGEVDGKVLAVVYTMRGEVCRIISARRANRNERRAYYAALARVAPSEPC